MRSPPFRYSITKNKCSCHDTRNYISNRRTTWCVCLCVCGCGGVCVWVGGGVLVVCGSVCVSLCVCVRESHPSLLSGSSEQHLAPYYCACVCLCVNLCGTDTCLTLP